jgi:hypothetical protein
MGPPMCDLSTSGATRNLLVQSCRLSPSFCFVFKSVLIVPQTWKLKTHTKLLQIQVYQEPTGKKAMQRFGQTLPPPNHGGYAHPPGYDDNGNHFE